MGRTQSSNAGDVAQRLVRVHEILDLCINRRMGGEPVSDEQVIAEHPELMPELAHELRGLAMIERARRSASSRSGNGRSSVPGRIATAALKSATLIPGYEIVKPIHSGAQGVVYEATQRSTQRTVAIKVMRESAPEGLRELSRFEREVQILATLRHPNIVSIHDSGLTPDGRAYFVMDFIDGRPLDDWISEIQSGRSDGNAAGNGPQSTPARISRSSVIRFLDVFATICDAVHAAHLRGVIHRDIKPANIRIDAAGQPHVLDFGLAKSVSQPADADMTMTGQFIGSLPWASPEQAEGAIEKIDVRTDVYALGVVLFQGLTGRFPYDVTGPMRDVLERIIHTAPRRPSDVAPRHAGPRPVDDELDTIVLKCLSKERDRRYQSAGELARDIRAYQSGEPIEAKRDSTMYVLRKTLRRYRGGVAVTATLVLLLAGFAMFASMQAERNARLARDEHEARRSADAARDAAESAQRTAAEQAERARRAQIAELAARHEAESAAGQSEAVTSFLVGTLGLANPDITQSPDLTMKSMLDRAADEIELRLEDQPASEARIRLVIGQAYATLGEPDKAIEQLHRAIELHDSVLRSSPRDRYPTLSAYLQSLYDSNHPRWRTRWWEIWRSALALLTDRDAELGAAVSRLATLSGAAFADAEARTVLDQVLKRADAVFAPDDPDWQILAEFLALAGDNVGLKASPDGACAYLRASLDIQRRRLPETHTGVVRTLGTLVKQLLGAGRGAEAEQLIRGSIAALETTLPADHWFLAVSRARLGACLIDSGSFAEAEAVLIDNLLQIETARGAHSAYAREIVRHQIALYDAWNRTDEANAARRSLAARIAGDEASTLPGELRQAFRSDQLELYDALERLRAKYRAPLAEFAAAADDVLRLLDRDLTLDEPLAGAVADMFYAWGMARGERRRLDEGTLILFRAAERIAECNTALDPWTAANIYFWPADNLESLGRYGEAETAARKALEYIESRFGNRANLATITRAVLGECLARRGADEEAEKLLTEAYQTLLGNRGGANARTVETLLRLVRFYETRGRARESLLCLLAQSRSQVVTWQMARPLVRDIAPELADAVEACLELREPDWADAQQRAARMIELGRQKLALDEPLALIYADVLSRVIDAIGKLGGAVVCEPLAREALAIRTAHGQLEQEKTAPPRWWLGLSLLEQGRFVEAESIAAEEVDRAREARWPTRRIASPEVLLGAALLGQRRFAEAEEVLLRVQPLLKAAYREDFFTRLEGFGWVVRLHADWERPETAAAYATPIMRSALEARRNAALLHGLCARVVTCEGLSDDLYALADAAAQAAYELAPRDASRVPIRALAALRAGRHAEALELLEPSPDLAAIHAIRALALHSAGRSADAQTECAIATQALRSASNHLSWTDRRLIEEAARRTR